VHAYGIANRHVPDLGPLLCKYFAFCFLSSRVTEPDAALVPIMDNTICVNAVPDTNSFLGGATAPSGPGPPYLL
jgi:hypothetical protein